MLKKFIQNNKKIIGALFALLVFGAYFVTPYTGYAQSTTINFPGIQTGTAPAPGSNSTTLPSPGGASTPSQPGTGSGFGTFADYTTGSSIYLIVKPLEIMLYIVMMLASLFLGLGGLAFDWTIQYTIVNLSQHINGIQGITIAWKLIRDLCNMSFIFILVYYGIRQIFGQADATKLIFKIIIAAVLINFSLFVTKIIIDASNVVTVSFYNSISQVGTQEAQTNVGTLAGTSYLQKPFSNALMNAAGVSSVFSVSNIWNTATNVRATLQFKDLTQMVLIIIVVLVITFIFWAMVSLFIVRYLAFIVLLILSPFAFVASVIPGTEGLKKKYWGTLTGQAYFAPLFMLMMWIVLTVSSAFNLGNVGAVLSNPTPDTVSGIMGYILFIGLLIYALILSKQLASQGGLYTGLAANKLSGFIGGTVFGATAGLGRNTGGRLGNSLSGNASLQESARENSFDKGIRSGIKGATSRLTLYGAKKAQKGSFDARNATVPVSALGDLVEGTIGRTGIGKKLGLNDVTLLDKADVGVGSMINEKAGLGKPETKGYKEKKTESDKRVREREAEATSNLKLAQNEQTILNGAKPGATRTEIEDMEKALSKISDKETEKLVAANRELLESQNFANSISVKQLEALNKSDQFSEAEKGKIIDNRFRDIESLMTTLAPGVSIPAGPVRDKIKALTDSEIEMLDPAHLSDSRFVNELRPGQVESITKSSRFSRSQKDSLRKLRMKPLMDALTAGNITLIQSLIRKVDPKTLASYMSVPGRPGGPNIALDPAVLPIYTPKTLKRMSQEMNPADIATLRTSLLTAGNTTTRAWLVTPEGVNEFS